MDAPDHDDPWIRNEELLGVVPVVVPIPLREPTTDVRRHADVALGEATLALPLHQEGQRLQPLLEPSLSVLLRVPGVRELVVRPLVANAHLALVLRSSGRELAHEIHDPLVDLDGARL